MPKPIGEQLKQARENRRLTVEQAADSTRIRPHYIDALEAGEFDSLPSPVQARAFLRLYAEFLKLSLDELIAQQRDEPADQPYLQTSPTPSTQEKIQAPQPSAVPDARPPVTNPENTLSRLDEVISKAKTLLPKKSTKRTPKTTTEIPSQQETTPASSEEEPPVSSRDNAVTGKDPILSQKIFSTIGDALRQRRETLSLTLEEIERHTHVRTHYLQALENGDFDRLPSSVQARGMLNNYAGFLDMDVDALLLKFAEGLQTQRVERQPKPMEETAAPAQKRSFKVRLPAVIRRYLSLDIVAGAGMVMVLLVFAVWGTSRVISARNAVTPLPTAPSISDILGSTPDGFNSSAEPTSEIQAGTLAPEAGPTLAVTRPASGPGVVHVVMVAAESAWARVTVDQKIQFEGRITSGTAYAFDGNTQIEVLTGNGAAVSIIYNESDLGAMGSWGQVVDHIYTADAILNPTATFTPSPTITPKPSLTPRPSTTPRPTFTPRNSPTVSK
jgi:cytoskeleton protein RodZ